MTKCTLNVGKTALSVLMRSPFGNILLEKSTHQAHLDPSLIAISQRYRLDDTLKLFHCPGLESSFQLMLELANLGPNPLGSLGVLE